MRKLFNVILPDEPYKNPPTFALNKTVECMYNGPRYIVCCVNTDTDDIHYVSGRYENTEDFDLADHKEDGDHHKFFVFDASENPLECAYLTHTYTHGPVQNFQTTLTTKDADGKFETYEYVYDDNNGILGHAFFQGTLKYNSKSGFSGPQRRVHALGDDGWDQVLASIKHQAVEIRKAIQVNDYFPAELEEINAYLEWCDLFEEKYADVDHWKIPFPKHPPHY